MATFSYFRLCFGVMVPAIPAAHSLKVLLRHGKTTWWGYSGFTP